MSRFVGILAILCLCIAVIYAQSTVSTTQRTVSTTQSTSTANPTQSTPLRQSYFAALLEQKRRLHKQLAQNIGNAIKQGGVLLGDGVINAMNIAHNGFSSFMSSIMGTVTGIRNVGHQAVNAAINGGNTVVEQW